MSVKGLIPWRKGDRARDLSPFMDLERMSRSLDRLADSLLAPFGSRRFDFPAAAGQELGGWDLQVQETDKAYEVSAKLPGIDKKNVRVDVRGGSLTIQAEQKEEKRTKEGWSSSRQSFFRSFALPGAVKAEKAKAEHRNGELRITLPKSEPARKVEVR